MLHVVLRARCMVYILCCMHGHCMCVQNTLDAAVALLHAFPEAVLKPDAAHRLPLQAPPPPT